MRQFIRRTLLYVTILAFAFAGTASASTSTLQNILHRGELRVAIQTQGPPMSFIDKDGERTGAVVELSKLMAKEMGVKIHFINYDWDGLIPALLSKKADLLAADMSPTLARATKVSFTTPWLYTGNVIFTKDKGSACQSIKECEQIKGLKVAVLLGSAAEAIAKKDFPKAEIKSYKGGGPLLMNAVLQGHADIGINDKSSIMGQMANFPPNSLQVLPGMLDKAPESFAVRYDSPDLRQWVNLFFQQTKRDGRLDKVLNYWVDSLSWRKAH